MTAQYLFALIALGVVLLYFFVSGFVCLAKRYYSLSCLMAAGASLGVWLVLTAARIGRFGSVWSGVANEVPARVLSILIMITLVMGVAACVLARSTDRRIEQRYRQ